MNLLDIIAAAETKDEAITRVGLNADPKWLNTCHNIITQIALSQPSFTTDDIWHALEATKTPPCHEPRVMGAVMRQVASEGLIVATGEYRPSARVTCHARPVRVWRRSSNVKGSP